MFKFLKDKLKSAISKISEGVEKEGKIEEKIIEKSLEEKKEEKGFFAKIKERFTGKEPGEEVKKLKPEIKAEPKPLVEHKKEERREIKIHKEIKEETTKTIEKKRELKPKHIAEAAEKKGVFAKLTEKIITTKINEEQFEKLFWGLEMALMESNVAIEVIEKIKDDLKEELVEKPIKRTQVEEIIQQTLRISIEDLFHNNHINLIQEIKNKREKPYVIAFFGINGSGKTTSIAKIANMLKEMGISCVLAASDTFRAASIEQLQIHADKVGVNMI